MIKITTTNQYQLIEQYLNKEPFFCTYIYGDISTFGLNSPILELFADDIESPKIVVMLFNGDFVIYSYKNNFNKDAVIHFLREKMNDDSCISGKASTVLTISDSMDNWNVRTTKLAILSPNYSYKTTNLCKIITKDDYPFLLKLYCSVEEFSSKYSRFSVEMLEQSLVGGHCLILKINNEIVATASSTAESQKCAMITNVCVDKNNRNNGYGSMIVNELLLLLINSGINTICLYYDNQIAGHIYKKIGFVDCGEYCTLRKKR